jgi:hypothetical protein
VLVVIAGVCGGCAVRRAPAGQSYRLFGQYLLPPGAPKQLGKTPEMRVSLRGFGAPPRKQSEQDCSIRDRWFSLFPRKTENQINWIATLPLPAAWQDSDLIVNNHAEWDDFFDQMSGLPAKECMSAADYWVTTNSVAESMPAPVIYALFFRYSFGSGGYIELNPGMRLFVERSIYRDKAGDTNSVKNYLGERKVYYDITRPKENTLALRRSGVWRSKGLSSRAGVEYPDTGLSRQFEHMHALRLFVLTLFVPPNVRRNSVLIGVRKPEDMVRVTHTIKTRPEIPCSELRSQDIACASFAGVVSASVEMDVRVNGRRQYVPIGSTVDTVLDAVPAEQKPAALKTLRIQRLFRGKYCDVNFNPANPELPILPLFAGDRISWRR